MIYHLFLLAAFFELGVSQKSSPCPSVFTYESPNSAEPDRWYGILILRNREQLKGIWIEVTLDETAQLLGAVTLNCTELCKPSLTNWFGETSTTDYQEFTIRDMTYTLEADTPMSMRFFVKYDRRKSVPSVVAIRLNGRLICGERPQQAASTTRRPQSGISLSEQSGANRGTGSGSGSRGTSSTSTNTNNGGRGTSSSSNSGNRGTGTGASGTNSRPATTQSSRPSSGGRVTTKPRPSSNTLTDSGESNYNSNSNREPVYTSNSASTSNNNRGYNSFDLDDSSQEAFLTTTNTNNYAQRNSNSNNRDTSLSHRHSISDGNFYENENTDTDIDTNTNQRNNNRERNNPNRYYSNTERNQIQEPINVDGDTLHLSNESGSNFHTTTNNNNRNSDSYNYDRSSDDTDNYDRSSSNRRNNERSEDEENNYNRPRNNNNNSNNRRRNNTLGTITSNDWNSNRNNDNRQGNNNSYNGNDSQEDNDKILFTSDDTSRDQNRNNIGRNTNSERENNHSNNDDDSSRQPGRNSNSRTSSHGRGTGYRNPENYGTSSSDNGNSYDNNGRDPDYGSNSNNNYNNNRPSGSSSSGSNNNRNPSFSGSNSGGGLSFAEDNNSEGDYFPGDFSVARPPAINRPSSSHKGNSGTSTIGIRQPRCGTVGVQPRPLITHAQGTTPGEWPWHVALYHSQGIQLKYICGGTLVSEKHIITAAHCVTKPSTTTTVGAENVLAYLGKYNLKKFGSEVQDREVSRIYIHPNYNSTYYFNDLAVLKLSEPVTMNNYVRASCLWEDESDLNSIVDQLGTVVGWGFDENKQISNELMKAEMPVVDTATCIYSNRDFFSQFTNEQTYCAGFRNGTSVCNGDSGGGMVFPKTHRDGSTTWQLRGVVSVGVALQGEPVCDSSHYIVFTDIAQHLEWIQEIMSQR